LRKGEARGGSTSRICGPKTHLGGGLNQGWGVAKRKRSGKCSESRKIGKKKLFQPIRGATPNASVG